MGGLGVYVGGSLWGFSVYGEVYVGGLWGVGGVFGAGGYMWGGSEGALCRGCLCGEAMCVDGGGWSVCIYLCVIRCGVLWWW